jgi:hypothetical protein
MSHSDVDHRWGPRVAICLPAYLVVPTGRCWCGRLQELSISGAWMDTPIVLPELSRVIVRIPSPDALAHNAATLRAYIARCGRNGLALGWMSLAPPLVAELVAEAAAANRRVDSAPASRPHL